MARISERAKNSIRTEMRNTVRGYAMVNTENESYNFNSKSVKYALLPVWMLSTKYKGENFLFAMNGQTGRMIGNLPISKAKQAIWFFVIFIVSLFIFGSFMLSGDDVTFSSYLITIIFGFIPAIIVNLVLIGQMKPVAQEKRASAYVTEGGMHLSVKKDRYTHTTESRTKIQDAQPKGGGAPKK